MISLERRQNLKKVTIDVLKFLFHEKEIWCQHPNADNYLVSNLGNIKSLKTNKLLKVTHNRNDYNNITLIFNDRRKSISVHRMVLESFFDISNNIYEVNHIDGNKNNNKLENLEWLTRKENLDHAYKNKLYKIRKGELNNNCKLTDKEVGEIRSLYKTGKTMKELKEIFSISTTHICGIINNQRRI